MELQSAGFRSIEAYTPIPVESISTRLKLPRSPMPWIILAGGLIGGASVFALICWINLSVYRINIGGRPLYSWPAFIPPTFEGIVLVASLFALIGVVLICGLPRWHHPVFEVEAFRRASTDGYFLAILATDVKFDADVLPTRLRDVGADGVWEVSHG